MKKETPPFYFEPDAEKLSEIKNYEIRELEEPIKKILEALQKSIKKGEYDYIIGDDTSGRIPTLVFDRILKAIAEKNGKKNPQTIFFAGQLITPVEGEKRQSEIEKLRRYLKHQMKDKNKEHKKVLIVTDTILSGNHLAPLSEVLKSRNINFDFATVGLENDFFGFTADQQKKQLEKRLGGKIFYGNLGTPSIYHAFRYNDEGKQLPLAGVKKHPDLFFTEPYKKEMSSPQSKIEIQQVIKQTREDVKILSEYLIDWFEKKFSDNSVQK